ncbi:MAG: FAD-binding domain-containing protein [Dermatophilaceae bacterium]
MRLTPVPGRVGKDGRMASAQRPPGEPPSAMDPHGGYRPVVRGGRSAALTALGRIDPAGYGRTRNSLDGAVTRLSPYLRHGVLTLDEVRRHVLDIDPGGAYTLVNELSWRDYFVRVRAVLGADVWRDIERWKTGAPSSAYDPHLPADIDQGRTGLACVDAWSEELRTTGYLHNHVRMWLASYLVHHRKVAWQAGARWFLTHLLDGDSASNNLSWQWVSSTFGAKPYLWNRENLRKYAGDRYCGGCPVRDSGCPFAASYDTLSGRLFPDGLLAAGVAEVDADRLRLVLNSPLREPIDPRPEDTVVWLHGERLSPTNEALMANPGRPAVYVWDEALWRDPGFSPLRATFLQECLAEVPAEARRGAVAAQVLAFAAAHRATRVATTPSVSPRFALTRAELEAEGIGVELWPERPFVRGPAELDLRRHSRYWRAVRDEALSP